MSNPPSPEAFDVDVMAKRPWFIDRSQSGASGKDTLAICHSGDPQLATPPIVCVVFRGYEEGPSWQLANFILNAVNSYRSKP